MFMNAEQFKKSLKGIVPVQICPYTQKGGVDYEGLKINTEFIVDFAKDGHKDVVLLTNGSTTEFYANSIEEQKKLIKTVVETVAGRIPVIAGVSQAAARQTIEMAKYAEEVGADCAMVVMPFYHHASKEGLYQYYQTVADAVKIGITVYNNPDVSGTMIPADLMARLAKIDNIVAVKDNSPLAAEYFLKSLLIDSEDMVLINGTGEVSYVGAAAYGRKYQGFVSIVANFAPALSYAVYEAVREGDSEKAYEALKKASLLDRFMGKAGSRRQSISVFPEWLRMPPIGLSIIKFAMNLVGLRGGTYHAGQLPTEDLTAEEKQEFKEMLKEMGVI